MATPTITAPAYTTPLKEQAKATFDTNIDGALDYLAGLSGELSPFITWTAGVRDEIAATALAGDLPDMTGSGGSFVRVNEGETAAGLRTPAQVLIDIGAAATASPTLTSPTLTNATFEGGITENVFSVTGATPALDPANGTIQTWTLSGASTPTDSLAAGESMTLMIDDGTAETITWPAMIWVNNQGSAPSLAVTGNTVVAIWKVSTTLYGALVGDGS